MKGNAFGDDGMADLERALRGRPGAEPSARLRERVLSGVDRALSEPAVPAGKLWLARSDLVGWAAVLLIGMALSRVAATATSIYVPPAPATSEPAVRAAAELVRQVTPGLTPYEAERLALASACRGDLLLVPVVDAGSVIRPPGASPSPRTPGEGWGGGHAGRPSMRP